MIRHKLSKDKKLFRITTHSGSVVVTDDHSLLTSEGKEISSKDLKLGDKLLHSFPEINNNNEYIFYMKEFNNDMDAMKYYYDGRLNGYNYNISYKNNHIIIETSNMIENKDNIISIDVHDINEEYEDY